MQLTDGEDLYNTVLRAPIGICILNADTLVAGIVNDKFLEVAGKPYDAIFGKYYWDAFAEARVYYESALNEVVQTGEAYHADEVELMLIRHGKEEMIFVTFVYSPVKDETGKVTKVAVWVLENTRQVTERQKSDVARAAAQKERDRLASFFMQAPAGICILEGPNLVFELVNPAYQRLLPGRKLLGRPIFEALPELAGTPLQEVLLNVYRTGESFDINELLIPVAEYEGGPTQDRYFTFNYLARRDENDQIDGILVFVFEVTAMIRVQQDQFAMTEEFQALNEELTTTNEELIAVNEELYASNEELTETQEHLRDTNRALQESEARLKAAFEAIKRSEKLFKSIALNIPKSLIIVIDKDHRYVTIEGELMERMGYDRKDYEGKHPTEVAPAERYEASKELYERVLAGETFSVERKASTGENFMVHFVPLKNERDEVDAGLIIALDITEIKQAEEKSAKLAAIIESSDDAIISKTLESVITSWNNSAERMFGYTAEEIIGQTIYTLIPADRQEEEPRILARLKSGERVDHFETRRVTKDGRELDVSLSISPILDRQGHIMGLSKIIRDITERKQDETRKNDFIGMVSHELKTPLTSLTAIVQVASQKLKQGDDAFLTGAMEKANAQVKRMSTMINGFLNISRLESGKIYIEKQPFNMDQLLHEMVEETKLTASTHEILLSSCGELEIYADRDKISSVISNLLSNAVKYSPKGKRVQLNCQVEGSEVLISVKDNGMGIKPHDIGHVFDRYYRVETNHTRHISGFGIGLYLSAEIIKRHDGKIWAESESGKGSTFYFSLPLH